jgi:putative DNA primase/helicase
MTAETIAKALGGRKAGGGWMVRCPVHDDREPSLSIRDGCDGKVLVHCHAGCDQQKVIAALKARGIWQGTDRRRHGMLIRSQPSLAAKDEPDRRDAERTQTALRLWGASVPATGTLVETYLRSRAIVMPIPATLRFHGGTKHARGKFWPAMVALVTRGEDDTPLAIHRTFLAHDGTGKAPVEPQKMMLGPCRSGVVRLGPIGDRLMIGEGIETALSVMQATGQAAWAALSTSGLRTLDLPDTVRNVIVLADGDEPGEAAALDAARRWKREGRCVRIARPPREMDFNDFLMDRADRIGDGAL